MAETGVFSCTDSWVSLRKEGVVRCGGTGAGLESANVGKMVVVAPFRSLSVGWSGNAPTLSRSDMVGMKSKLRVSGYYNPLGVRSIHKQFQRVWTMCAILLQ